jgi:hypothetical protein
MASDTRRTRAALLQSLFASNPSHLPTQASQAPSLPPCEASFPARNSGHIHNGPYQLHSPRSAALAARRPTRFLQIALERVVLPHFPDPCHPDVKRGIIVSSSTFERNTFTSSSSTTLGAEPPTPQSPHILSILDDDIVTCNRGAQLQRVAVSAISHACRFGGLGGAKVGNGSFA